MGNRKRAAFTAASAKFFALHADTRLFQPDPLPARAQIEFVRLGYILEPAMLPVEPFCMVEERPNLIY